MDGNAEAPPSMVFQVELEEFHMGGDERPQARVRHSTARANGGAVEVTYNLGRRLWPRLMIITVTPDDAMRFRSNFRRQQLMPDAAIDARQCEHRRDVTVGGTKSLNSVVSDSTWGEHHADKRPC
jgi:hypothetical protein